MDFVGAVSQIVPVILLAMVVEARLIRMPGVSRLDHPDVKAELIRRDGRLSWYTTRIARAISHPIWTLLGSMVLVTALLAVETWCLWALYSETPATHQGARIIVGVVLAGLFMVALYPLASRLAQINSDNDGTGLREDTSLEGPEGRPA